MEKILVKKPSGKAHLSSGKLRIHMGSKQIVACRKHFSPLFHHRQVPPDVFEYWYVTAIEPAEIGDICEYCPKDK